MPLLFAASYRNEIWVLKQLKRNISISVVVFDTQTKQFLLRKENLLNIDLFGRDFKTLEFSCILEESTGVKKPCLLIEHQQADIECTLQFYFFVNDKKLAKVASFHNKLSICGRNFILSGGPSLSWLHENTIHFLRWISQSRNLIHTSYCCLPNITGDLRLLWSGTSQGQLLTVACYKEGIILAEADNGSCSSERILPSLYASVVDCLCIYDRLNVDTLFANEDESYCKQEIFIGTSKGQLIKFTEGRFISHWQLPLDDPCSIEILEHDVGLVYAIVKSTKNKICIINLSLNKVINTWSNQEILLIGDFFGNGSSQLCMVQESTSVNSLINSSVLTTVNGKTIGIDKECSRDKTENQSMRSECISSTIQALRTRFQASKSHLSELRMEYQDKVQMMENTCQILNRVAGNSLQLKDRIVNESVLVMNDTRLVGLIGDELKSEETGQSSWPRINDEQPEFSFKISEIWQRVIDNNWTIGVDLKDVDKSNVSDISISLLSCSKENLKSSCHLLLSSNNPRLIAVNQSDEILPPSLKRQKLEHSVEACVVLVTNLPSFRRSKNFSCLVTLSWTACGNNPSRHAACCGYVHLDIDQLIREELSISKRIDSQEQKHRNQTVLRAISLETALSIDQVPIPFNLLAALRKELDMILISDVRKDKSEEMLFSALEFRGIQEGVCMVVDNKIPAQKAELQLFTRNIEQIYVNIFKIRDALPDGVGIWISKKISENIDSKVLDRIHKLLAATKYETKPLSNKRYIPTLDMATVVDCTADDKLKNIRKKFEDNRKRFSCDQTII